jgi:peptide/nickel transport system permease protein
VKPFKASLHKNDSTLRNGDNLVNFIVRRLLQTILVVLLVSIVSYLIIQMIPGDPVVTMLGGEASQERIDALRHELWLDRPLPVQYFHWLGNVVQGNFGKSIATNDPVTAVIKQRLPVTVYLSFIALVVSTFLGIFLGILSAVRRGTLLDPFINLFANVGVAIPVFWLGILGAYFLGLKLHWLSIQGFTWPTDDFGQSIRQTVMPVVCLAVSPMAVLARQTRSSVLEVIHQDYIRTAMSKGLRERVVVFRHVIKNALIPVVTLLGLQVRVLFGGSVLVEQVFNINGMGRTLVSAAFGKDFPVLQAGVLLIAILVCAANLIVDLSYSWLDPRIRYE